MPHDSVDILRRMHRAAQDEAKRAFALRLAEEDAARRLLEAAQARMTRERDIATDPAHGDGAVEAYIAWLPAGRLATEAAQAAYERATTNVTLARAELNLAHAATQAVTNFLAEQAAAENAAEARQSQAKLDEVAARPTATLG